MNYLLNKRNDTWIRNLHDVDKIIAISKFIKKELEKNVIYNICTIYNISPIWTDDENVSKSTKDTILFTPGRFHDEKGMDISIRVLDIILKSEKNIKLVLLGDGPNKNKLKKLVSRLDLRDYVEFIDRVPFKDVKILYQMSDIVIFCPSYQEPLGRVAIEAGASGKPIVTSNVGGIPEIVIDGKTGFLVKPNSAGEVADKVMRLINNKSLYKEMGINAREHIIKKFDQNKIVSQHINLYKEVIENGS
jgi:glycosyltransferase involved in cell wall biosynthesis